MNARKKSATLALVSMAVGIAAMPVAAMLSTVAGLGLASLSIYLIYIA